MMYLKEALSKYQEILNNLEFARELQKSFLALGQEVSPELQLFSQFADQSRLYLLWRFISVIQLFNNSKWQKLYYQYLFYFNSESRSSLQIWLPHPIAAYTILQGYHNVTWRKFTE